MHGMGEAKGVIKAGELCKETSHVAYQDRVANEWRNVGRTQNVEKD